jgi:hypothetical protein
MIDEELAARVVARFIEVTVGRWPNVFAEIQDDWSELLLIVHATPAEVGEISPILRRAVVDALNELIPVTPADPVGNWVIGFRHEEKIYDSILANEVSVHSIPY